MNRNYIRWILVLVSFIIISLILWNTYVFFNDFKEKERSIMQTWSISYSDFASNIDDLEAELSPVTTHILTDTSSTTPMMLIDPDGSYGTIRNIDTTNVLNVNKYLEKLKIEFQNENQPIEVRYREELIGTVYYGNAPLLTKLKYYPLALMLIIFLFGAVVFFFYRSTKNAAQNKLWTGMAKETAHQIGTPLSSLIGWAEILKSENVNPEYLVEIEKDINRLLTITDRFSKIGSVPKLTRTDIVKETIETYEYLKARSSKLINFELEAPNDELFVELNPQLYSWTIENMVKNAIDAMKGKGDLKLRIIDADKFVKVTITDTGKGIPKPKYSKVFEPGYTSKKRGWGLGLSLAKRIVEDYHNGKIKVLNSELNKGTTMQIALRLIP